MRTTRSGLNRTANRISKLFSLLLVIVFLSSCGGGGSGSVGKTSEVKFSPEGTSYSKGEFSLEVPAGVVQSETVFTVTSLEEDSPLPSDIAYYSAIYNLVGDLESLEGSFAVTVEIPDEALEGGDLSAEDLESTFFMTILEDYDPGNEDLGITLEFDIPVDVDLEGKTVTGVIDFDQLQAALGGSAKVFSPSYSGPEAGTERTSLAFRIGRTWTLSWTLDSAQGNFRAVHSKGLDRDALDNMLDSLEEAKVIIEEMGLEFQGRTKYPIIVNVKDLGASDGEFSPSYFINSRSLNIHSKFFQPGTAEGYQDLVKATAGHELLHLAQSFYWPKDNYYLNNLMNLLWMDEASATWFEAVILKDPGVVPNTAETNFRFYQTPLNFPDDPANHGYGASWYLRFLTDQAGLGNSLIPEIYQFLYQSGGENESGSALEAALEARGGTSVELWPKFLETYFLKPEELSSPALSTLTLTEKIYLSSEIEQGTGEPVLVFAPGPKNTDEFEKYDLRATRGHPEQEGSYPEMNFSVPLEQLTGKGILIGIQDKQQIMEGSGTLTVEGFSSAFSGVNIYGIPESGISNAEFIGNSFAEVKGVGPQGKYRSVMLILYNADPTMGSVSAEEIQIKLTYQPLNQCVNFEGSLITEYAEFAESPCADYTHCDSYVASAVGEAPEAPEAMGEAGDFHFGGDGLCSEAPIYCLEKIRIATIVPYIQPGAPIPFFIDLVERSEDENWTTGMRFDRYNDENAKFVMRYFYNTVGVDSDIFPGEFNPVEHVVDQVLAYGRGEIHLTGTLGEEEGSGTFTLSHPDMGTFTSGSWSATCVEEEY